MFAGPGETKNLFIAKLVGYGALFDTPARSGIWQAVIAVQGILVLLVV
jgi:hypothetical protein